MVIEIKPDVFNSLENLQAINYLLSIFTYKYRYEVLVDITSVQQTELYKNLNTTVKEILGEYFNRIITASKKIDYIVSVTDNNDFLTPEESIIFFQKPFIIILENSLNDGYFINALYKAFKKEAKRLSRFKDEGWVIYGMGGGANNIINYVSGLLTEYDNLPKENHNYLRCFAILDSDKEYPEMEIKPDKKKLLAYLNEVGIKYHILEKREIENYLPSEVFAEIENNDDFVEAYLKLSPLQKDFFDIEQGFGNKKLQSLAKPLQELFGDLNAEDVNALRNGMKLENFKSNFPKLFLSSLVTRESFLNRCSHQKDVYELKNIVIKIDSLL